MLRGSCRCRAVVYSAAGPIESASGGRRAFCQRCGSTLFWRSEQSPERIAVTLGTLDSPFTDPVEIELHTDTKPSWLPIRDPACP